MNRRSLNVARNGKPKPLPHVRPKKKKSKHVVLCFLVLSFIIATLILLAAVSALPDPNHQTEGSAPMPGLKRGKPRANKSQKGVKGTGKKPNADAVKQKKKDVEYYMVFSTACSTFQDWQSYVFFYSAMKVKQPGHVIRLASGCSDDKIEHLKQVHKERVHPMSENFHVHFTPDFAGKGKEQYKYNNKPFGLRHFLENFLGYPEKKDAEDAIVIIVDPDQMLLKPITNDFSNTKVVWHMGPDEKAGRKPLRTRVEHGYPMAQLYAFGPQPFQKVNLTKVAGEDSLTHKVSVAEASAYYPAGPPYIATVKDMYNVAYHWTSFMGAVHREYPGLLGEMFGYCLAAAHVGLPHQIAQSFMVSDPDFDLEGWPLLDKYPTERMCEPDAIPTEDLPQVMHYCQNYNLGKWFIGKYRLDPNFISCEAPLLTEPPSDVGLQYDYYIRPGGIPYGTKEKLTDRQVKRVAWSLCFMIRALNEVAVYFKETHCDTTANFDKTYVFGPNRTEYKSHIDMWSQK